MFKSQHLLRSRNQGGSLGEGRLAGHVRIKAGINAAIVKKPITGAQHQRVFRPGTVGQAEARSEVVAFPTQQ